MSDTRKYRYIREDLKNKNTSYVNNKNKLSPNPHSKLDETMLRMGVNWYRVGHTLEEADTELSKNESFVRGYKHAETQDIVNDQLYNLGMEYFEKGIPLSSIPANYMIKSILLEDITKHLD